MAEVRRRAAGGRRGHRPRGSGDAAGHASPVPAGRLQLARIPVRPRPRRCARRRHGPGEDRADPRADLPCAARTPGRRAVPGRGADERGRQLGGGMRKVRSGPAGGRQSPKPRLAVASTCRSWSGTPISSSPRMRCSGWTLPKYSAPPWSGLILDEAQVVKNHQSKAFQCAIKLSTPFKLAITGTPMENNLLELWSIFAVTAPGLFPQSARFREYYQTPIERSGDSDRLAQLRRRIRPLMLRRTKEEVAKDLPPKQEQVIELEMNAAAPQGLRDAPAA